MSETTRQLGLPAAPESEGTPIPAVRSVGLAAGTCVGEYRIGRSLGRGGMGCVYEARDEELGRTVALKTLLPGVVVDALTREQILTEARALAAVANEHVVTVHRVGVHDGVPYLVMELLTGESLAAVMARGPLPLLQTLKIGREVANGLAAAHRAGLVHRDVKPENVFLDARRDRAIVVDFGLADPNLPNGLGLIGSPPYMPPEQVRGEPLDGRTDLYSLGAVLYRLCTGRLPIPVDQLSVWRNLVLSDAKPEPADRVNPAVPPPLARLLTRMLAKSPADRPAAAAEVEWELVDLLRTAAEAATGKRSSGARAVIAPPRPAPRRTASRVALASAVLALGLVAVAVPARFRSVPDQPIPAPDAPQPPRPATAPPIPLFDGRSLRGWTSPDGMTDQWTVKDGVLIGTPGDHDQFLLSDRAFSDFVLEFEFRWRETGGHTTVLVRAKDDGPVPKEQRDAGQVRVSGLEVNIGGEVDPELDRQPPLYASGGVYKIRGPRGFAPNRPIGEWNRVRVTHVGQQLTIEWNGVLTFDEDLTRHPGKTKELPALTRSAGAVALHTHGYQAIEFRSITIAEVVR